MEKTPHVLGQVPFLRFLAPFILGIYASNSIQIEPVGYFWIAPIVCIILLYIWNIIPHLNSRKHLWEKGFLIFLFFLSFGISLSKSHQKSLFSPDFEKMEWYTGIVVDHSPSSKERQKYVVNIDAGYADSCYHKMRETIVLYTQDALRSELIFPGSRISFVEKPNEIRPPQNPGEFDYKRYMLRKGIKYQLYSRQFIKVENTPEHTLKTRLFIFRSNLLDKFQQYGISGDEFGVLAALTLGEKDYLSDEIKSGFTNTGAMHVLAVSGLHVGIIYIIFMLLLKPLGRNPKYKIVKSLIVIAMLWAYAFTTGLSPSVLRATTMFTFLAMGEGLKRKPSTYNSLATSAFVLLVLNPNLIYEVGFQLSYLAVFSIVFFQPRFSKLWTPRTKAGNYIWQLFTVSLAAQIGTSPISIFYFNQFACYFWLSNFVVIPAAGLILYTTTVFFLVSFVPALGVLVGGFLKWIIRIMNFGILTIEKLPYALISDIWISQSELIVLYLITICTSILFFYHKKWAIFATLSSIIMCLSINCYQEIEKENQQVIIFHQNSKKMLISFILGQELFYASEDEDQASYEKRIIENTCKVYGIRNVSKINNWEKSAATPVVYDDKVFVFQGISIGMPYQDKELPVDIRYQRNLKLTLSAKNHKNRIIYIKSINSKAKKAEEEPTEYDIQKDGALSLVL